MLSSGFMVREPERMDCCLSRCSILSSRVRTVGPLDRVMAARTAPPLGRGDAPEMCEMNHAGR